MSKHINWFNSFNLSPTFMRCNHLPASGAFWLVNWMKQKVSFAELLMRAKKAGTETKGKALMILMPVMLMLHYIDFWQEGCESE